MVLAPVVGLPLESYQPDEVHKMNVRPGLSGYTQALLQKQYWGSAKSDLKDAWYADNISFCLDVKIFFKTIVTVLKHDNVYTN